MAHVKTNPIVGHGMGVSYQFWDITWELTRRKPFIHNGYAALWFKFGLWGLITVMTFFGMLLYRAYTNIRLKQWNDVSTQVALAFIGTMCAFALAAITSNPFYHNDNMFLFALICGLLSGCVSHKGRQKGWPTG